MEEATEEVQFIDAENYMPGQEAPLTYEMIVLQHIRRCAALLIGITFYKEKFVLYIKVGKFSL